MSARKIWEPVQLYLNSDDRERLDRLAARLEITRSDVIREAIRALESQLADPKVHPALRLITLAAEPPGIRDKEKQAPDAAREHDLVLADDEEAAWKPPPRRRRGT